LHEIDWRKKMAIEVRVPEVGESISQVEVGRWLKNEGDFVERDDEVVVIETDKATVEVPAPESGILTKIVKSPGETAAVHEVIGYIEPNAEKCASPAPVAASAAESPLPEKPPSARDKPRVVFPSGQAVPSADDQKLGQPPAKAPAPTQSSREVEEAKEEAEQVDGAEGVNDSGKGRQPPQEPRRSNGPDEQRSAAKSAGRAGEAAERPAVQGQDVTPSAEQIVPMSSLRRRIAERLVQAQHSAALLTTFNEIDMTTVIGLRERYRDAFKEKHQAKLGFMSFFVKAAIEALRLVPEVNAEIRGENVVYRNYFDVGIAVGGGKGLVVPVLRHAERMSFAEIERAIADFARRAEENTLRPEELKGGTFTISNGGIYGSLLSTPIVNPPQSGILGLHAIQDRPVAREGAIVIRSMMYVALSYDHRLIDGREAVTFLKHVKDLIEDPTRLVIGL
jgi:2-oxoglutarate dehydrogenase E2 component (dihydrolipoamide succinyltransferase)